MSDCLFCKMVSGDIEPDILHSDEHVLAIRDINPQAPFHALVIPRKHIALTIRFFLVTRDRFVISLMSLLNIITIRVYINKETILGEKTW